MRFARYRADDAVGVGVVSEDRLVYPIAGQSDLLPLIGAGLPELLAAGRAALHPAANPIPEAAVSYLSPIATPPTFRDFYAFEQHAQTSAVRRGASLSQEWYSHPTFYFSSPYAFTGCGDVPMTPGTAEQDFELEVAAIVGGYGSDLTVAEAEELIIGYSVLNDWSARDIQRNEMQLMLGPAKGKDAVTSMGPYLVTKDELADARDGTGFRLGMTCEVNGKGYSRGMWSDVHYSFPEMIAYASAGSQVRPGDVFGSGTCGTGCIMELAATFGSDAYPWLRPGDVVSTAVDRLGVLTNRLVPPRDPVPLRWINSDGRSRQRR